MNKTLYRLAYRNIVKYKKHYIFVSLIIIFISVFYSTYSIVQTSYFQVSRLWNEQEYGSWYFYGQIAELEKFDKVAYQYEDKNGFEYAYLFDQGKTENEWRVSYADQSFFELCQIRLVEGQFPQNEDEIMISEELKEDYQLNQILEIRTSSIEERELKIVGIVHNSQERYFSDIYTNIPDKYETTTIFSDRNLAVRKENMGDYYVLDISLPHFTEHYSGTVIDVELDTDNHWEHNPYGYNHNESMANFQEKQTDLFILLQVLLITSFVLITFTSASLKQRVQEFALMRGIGMTTRQLILMSFYENVLCLIIAIMIGTLLSPLISYIIMLGVDSLLGYFAFILSSQQLFVNGVIILICMSITLLYPISKSSKRALSGTFDSYTFQYIQVRYRNLHYQNKWRLAWRELKTNKKMHFFLIIVLCFHTGLFLINTIITTYNELSQEESLENYTTVEYEKTKRLSIFGEYDLSSLNIPNTYYTYVKSDIPCQYENQDVFLNQVFTCDQEIIEKSDIKGRKPVNDYEALIVGDISPYHLEENVSEGEIQTVHTNMDRLLIGDTLVLNNQEIEIVGSIEPADTIETRTWYGDDYYEGYYTAIDYGIYISSPLYQKIKDGYESEYINIFYEDDNERNLYIQNIEKLYPELLGNIEIQDHYIFGFSNLNSAPETFFNSYVLCGSFVICIFLCSFMNKNEMVSRKNDYALMQLIGMTKKDLLIKQLLKGFIIFIIITCFNLLLIALECFYLRYFLFPYVEFIIVSMITLIVCFIVYSFPLLTILKKKPLDNLIKTE